MKTIRLILFSILLSAVSVLAFAGSVNINKADAATMASEVRGIGPKTAKAIVAYRKKHGSFKTVDDLTNVKGIGQKKLAKIRKNIVVSQ